jgi:hypothetical protein
MPLLHIIAIGSAVVFALAMLTAWLRFRRRVSINRQTLLAGSRIVQTRVGPIEVAETGGRLCVRFRLLAGHDPLAPDCAAVPTGGHVRLGQVARLREEITGFIEAHASPET